jgi:dihydrofolate reductase
MLSLCRTLVHSYLYSPVRNIVTMRKIILNVAVSLDGFIEDANGAYDWCFTDQDYGLTDFSNSIDTVFFGRKSYELVLKENYTHYYKGYKQYVFSTTIKKLDDDSITLITGNVKDEVNKIRNEQGRNIWLFGGASLVSFFMKEDLVDELMLSVHPILLGSGKPLFQNLESRKKLDLTNSITFNSGLVQLFYNVNKAE